VLGDLPATELGKRLVIGGRAGDAPSFLFFVIRDALVGADCESHEPGG